MDVEVKMETDPAKIIEELLDQNASLRLELAILSAMKKEQDELEAKMQDSQNIPPEALEMLSKLDIR